MNEIEQAFTPQTLYFQEMKISTGLKHCGIVSVVLLAISLLGCGLFSGKVAQTEQPTAPPVQPNPWPAVKSPVPARPGDRAEAIG
ncbi:MAG: hypothetical protein HY074_16860, partial [Deltaproteobacteria bacterium]|nr:hypothetical protein [Deltaproteobacteria bacterium]